MALGHTGRVEIPAQLTEAFPWSAVFQESLGYAPSSVQEPQISASQIYDL